MCNNNNLELVQVDGIGQGNLVLLIWWPLSFGRSYWGLLSFLIVGLWRPSLFSLVFYDVELLSSFMLLNRKPLGNEEVVLGF